MGKNIFSHENSSLKKKKKIYLNYILHCDGWRWTREDKKEEKETGVPRIPDTVPIAIFIILAAILIRE